MSNDKLDSFTTSKIHFLSEQIGVTEHEFKKNLIDLLRKRSGLLRAYLAQVGYSEPNVLNVALCIASERGDDEELARNVASVFSHIFSSREHLDVLFLKGDQEVQLRKVCCPFFSVRRFERPDFYLTSNEGYSLQDIRACYKERRFVGEHPDGYMLCEVDPPILGQSYGLGGQDIQHVVLASRHAGYSIFAVDDWPRYVHVARLTRDVADDEFVIAKGDIESVGWAEIYGSSACTKALF